MRILFIGNGDSIHTRRWVQAMANRGAETFLATDGVQVKHMDGVSVELLPTGNTPVTVIRKIFQFRRLAKDIKPDIIHAHYISSYGLYASFVRNIPLVLTAWGSDLLLTGRKNIVWRIIVKAILSRAQLITANSDQICNLVKNINPNSWIEQVQWGVNLSNYREPLGRKNSDVLRIISPRPSSPIYNVGLIIKAFAQFVQEFNGKARLDLFGGGSLENEHKKLAHDLGIEECLFFHGRIPADDMCDYFLQADIAVTVPTSDGTSISLLESMAAAIPVIASDIAPNRQWINQGAGMIVPLNNVDEIYRCLLTLATNDALRESYGRRGRQLVEKFADTEIEMDRMFEFCSNLATRQLDS
jgi:glycosyltransferase involved in cell wall biosynthesis